MYAYIFFAIFIVSLFSIFENIKGHQKMSFFKVHLQIALFFIALGSFLFFLDEIGINVLIYVDIARVFGLIALVNIFFILANNKIPRLVIYFEILFAVVLLTMVYNGFKYIAIKNGVINVQLNFIQLFNIFIINGSLIASMFYNIFKIHKQLDKKNIYHLKIRNWTFFLLIIVISMVLWVITAFILDKYHIANLKSDTRVLNSMAYSLLLVFVLFRPRFIDEANFSYSISKFSPQKSLINAQDFDFLFYFNHYYLKKQDSFTIEALSEMSGFKSRKTMYNTFNKYHNMTPSEFINKL